MKFCVLGAPRIGDDTGRMTAPKGMVGVLLSALLLRANQAVPSETLVAALWPTTRPASANANLRQYASRLRGVLTGFGAPEAARLRSTAGGYLIEVRPDELDLTCFEELMSRGREALSEEDFRTARCELEKAVGLWTGPICRGKALGAELEMEVFRWEELRLSAHRLLLEARLQLGDYHRVIAEIRPLLVRNPLHEELWGMLMLAFYRSYRRAEALKTFRMAHRRFIQDLGVEPTADLQRLYQAILRGDCPLDGFAWLSRTATGRPPTLADATGSVS